MRSWRFLPLLILCCALDLAVPVAPTPGGVEFEDDEEVVQPHVQRATRQAAHEARLPTRPSVGLNERARLSASGGRSVVRRALGPAHVAAVEARPSDPGGSPPSPSEDH